MVRHDHVCANLMAAFLLAVMQFVVDDRRDLVPHKKPRTAAR